MSNEFEDEFMRDFIVLIKPNGDRTENIKVKVSNNGIKIYNVKLQIEPGDIIERKLPNDLIETYEVLDVTYHNSAIPESGPSQLMKVRKLDIAVHLPTNENAESLQHSNDSVAHAALRVFISHSSQDEGVAKALVEVLETALSLKPNDIRCTSVPGYKLHTGAHTSVQLKNDINDAEVIIGIITTKSMKSSYVLFELGASWGLNKPTFPLLACGADFSILPGPLKERHASSLHTRHDIQQVIDDVVHNTSIKRQSGVAAKVEGKIDSLLAFAKEIGIE